MVVFQSRARNLVLAFGAAATLMGSVAEAVTVTDPCTLLSAVEAQSYVGVLTKPPFRADDNGAADAHGKQCIYCRGDRQTSRASLRSSFDL